MQKRVNGAGQGRSHAFSWRWALLISLLGAALITVGLLPKRAHGVAAGMASENQSPERVQKAAVNLGSWTAPLTIGVVAIHAALLTNGQVLMWYTDAPFGSGTGSLAQLWNPATNALTDVKLPFPYDIFCSGMTMLPNGQLLVIGGKDDSKGYGSRAGIAESFLFNPTTNTWSQAADMNYARWYPTGTEQSDGTVLVTSGTDDNSDYVLEQEVYNYQTNVWTVLPASADISANIDIYPRMVLLPSGQVFTGGMYNVTQMFNPATNTWSSVGNLNFGQRVYGGQVLLPGLEQVLAVGGNPNVDQTGTATNTVEMINFAQPTPKWTYVASMNEARQNENLILMPDGTVLAVGGGGGGGRYTNPVYQPEEYNPTSNTWTLYNPQQAQRTYHSTALLLPDGRVFSAGSDSGPLRTTLEVFSPPYLSNGLRPTITSAPSTLTYGQQFTIKTPNAAGITRVALIKVASATHATRFDERFVDLTFTLGKAQITATAPPSSRYAPPGYYMLDILSKTGVPAVMPMVQLSSQ
ncbi:MAG TPA: galactose oxidase-like domain-containing protein [Terriglobia bacterium]